ncbi:anti-repressor SinI family protein [Sediminibacillus albus]|uniref:Anti-repressor SinI n=1 Tax=Sediminibacillus albus TaxID=407036 RepID=A0A1G9B803_9BACI|nr:anti-repressor SinI family protein [Sediminibacillus albus]SDK35647.1 Anti-repressor SinI [Sediminibacillus albus]
MSKSRESGEHLDKEWIELMLNAKGLGITQDEIRSFLSVHRKPGGEKQT